MKKIFQNNLKALIIVTLHFVATTLSAITYTVTSTANGTTTDGVSLRWAITQANAAVGNTIAFNISGTAPHTITLTSALPVLTKNNTTIDGSTQPANGYDGVSPRVIINGNNTVSKGIEASLTTDQIKIYGLYIKGFTDHGIYLPAQLAHIIGTSGKGNVISGNGNASTDAAIYIKGGTIKNNIIGMNITGTAAEANTGYGIQAIGGLVIIGSGVSGEGNLISANTNHGILLDNCSNSIIKGNKIGTDATGITNFGNTTYGIFINNNSQDNQVGGTGANEGNIIAYNGNAGVGIDAGGGSATNKNNIQRNSVFCNDPTTYKGISLINNGNNGVAAPIIILATGSGANGTSVANATIEIFESNSICNGAQGKKYKGTTTANGSGNWTYTGALTGEITATQTTIDGTSQFSSRSVAGGNLFSTFLCTNGTVHSTGFNAFGQLGDGTNVDKSTPVAVSSISNIIAISSGAEHTLALQSNGEVWAWGYNAFGQLGDGNNGNSNLPVKVSNGSGNLTGIVAVSAGDDHSLALDNLGRVWSWGRNANGQLGDGTSSDNNFAVLISTLTNVAAITAGDATSMALRCDGTVWLWGSNEYGQLGDGTTIDKFIPTQEANGFTNIKAIAFGGLHSLILNNTGTVYTCGNNFSGQLGNSLVTSLIFSQAVNVPTNIVAIAGGFYHSLAIDNTGVVKAWGSNNYGQLGNNSLVSTNTAVTVTGLTGIVSISAGQDHSLALKNDGTAWAWGRNDYGQLGDATTILRKTPVQVSIGCAILIPAILGPVTANAGNDAAICAGSSTQLNATGGGTYSWSPAIGLSSTTIANPLANPTITTTYVVTVTGPSGCTATDAVLVTVNPLPTVTATASPATIVLPATSQLTATSSGVTYSWNTGGSTSVITVSPTVTTTYTVTVTSTTTGCTAKTTVVVRVVPASCNLTYDYVVPYVVGGVDASTVFGAATTITNKNISVLGDLKINNNMIFSGCNLVMDPDVKINLTTGNLTLNSKTHIYACTNMWDGIYVPTGRTLNTTGSAFIEDAKSAINIAAQVSTVSLINFTIFNKNLAAVTLTANTNTLSPINFRANVVTSRTIPFTATTSTNSSVADVITNIISTSSWVESNLRAPYTDRKGCYGVDATDVNNVEVGKAVINQWNYFDAIMCGVNLIRSNAIIYNNKFQNLLGYNNPPTYCPNPPRCYVESGYGVQTMGTLTTGLNTITIGDNAANKPNTFNNIYQAISVQRYKTQTVKGNSITNTYTSTFLPGNSIDYGDAGIRISEATANNIINISSQTLIKNCKDAIHVYRASTAGTSSLIINDNGDAANTPTVPCITADASGYCTNGIFINDLGIGSVVPTIWEIKNNVVSETANCINLLNVKKPLAAPGTLQYEVKSNSVTTRYAASGNTNGIKAKGCEKVSIVFNHTKYTGTPYSSGNILSYGIYLQNSSNMLVKCNYIDDAARSMVFEGSCISSTLSGANVGITLNRMYRAQEGFVLKNNGEIGQQGSDVLPNGDIVNSWIAPFSNAETFTENTSNANTNSKLYIGPGNMPINNKSAPVNFEYSQVFGGLNLTYMGNGGCEMYPPASVLYNNNGMERVDRTPPVDLVEYSSNLEKIEKDNSQFSVYNEETRWMRKKFVYDELKNNSVLNSRSSLQKFYADKSYNYSKFAEVEAALSNKQYSTANSINASITPVNVLESNQQVINTLILQTLLDDRYVYIEADKKLIRTIALQCPFSGGYAVYQARNMLMGVENRIIEFEDNCDQIADRSMQEAPLSTQTTMNTNKSFNLYPNPNKGSMVLDYDLKKDENGTIKIYDLTGKLMVSYLLNANQTQLQINNTELNNGIYMYNIIINNKTVKTDKLVIIKQ
ncbi:MAG: RCC1 domain-containing protein [Bacteroidota bacterium]